MARKNKPIEKVETIETKPEVVEQTPIQENIPLPSGNTDLYVTIVADDDFHWPGYVQLFKGRKERINQKILEKLIEDKGNFNIAVEKGVIRIGD